MGDTDKQGRGDKARLRLDLRYVPLLKSVGGVL